MAHLLRRPLLGVASSRRCFSQYAPLQASIGAGQVMPGGKQKERSIKNISQNITAKDMPSDVGLLPETFVPGPGSFPTHSKRSSRLDVLFSRIPSYLWNRIRNRLRDWVSLRLLKYSSPGRYLRRKVDVSQKDIVPTALSLHRQMYTAFAAGDTATLQGICADGLRANFITRIGVSRAEKESLKWELVKYKGRAKIVSDRAAKMPLDGAGARQVVVRISSVQKLTKMKRGKRSEETKDLVEYLVIQKMWLNWNDRPWVVWGTTKPTEADEVERWVRKRKAGKE